jgi:hypothetical protein
MKVSNGDIFSVNASPESKDIRLTLPVLFLSIVLLTIEFGMYSIISTIIRAFDGVISMEFIVMGLIKYLPTQFVGDFLGV